MISVVSINNFLWDQYHYLILILNITCIFIKEQWDEKLFRFDLSNVHLRFLWKVPPKKKMDRKVEKIKDIFSTCFPAFLECWVAALEQYSSKSDIIVSGLETYARYLPLNLNWTPYQIIYQSGYLWTEVVLSSIKIVVLRCPPTPKQVRNVLKQGNLKMWTNS